MRSPLRLVSCASRLTVKALRRFPRWGVAPLAALHNYKARLPTLVR